MIPQKFFYPLYALFDKKFFAKLNTAVKDKYIFVGSAEDKTYFVKSLFYHQLINKEYRKPLKMIYRHLKPQTNLKVINQLIESAEMKEDLSWVNWQNEKEMIKLATAFWRRKKVEIIGTDEEFNEFVLRYLISAWLIDWIAPLYALLKSTKGGKINLRECNEIISFWDFTKIFAK